MISKAEPPIERPAVEASAPGPASLSRSEAVQQTIRQLAAVTQRFTQQTDLQPRSGHTAVQPATAQAVAAPTVPAPRRASPRDVLARAKMARVLERAETQHLQTRELFTILGVMPAIDPGYVGQHKSMPLGFPGVGAACSEGSRPYQQDVAMADWCNPHAFGVAAVCDGHGRGLPGEVAPWHWLEHHLIDTLRAHLPPHGAAKGLTPHAVCKALTRAIDGSRAQPRYPLSVVEQMDSVNAVDNGSTLTAAVRIADTIYLVNVGDSRAVLVRRDGRAQQLTVDHNIDEPEEWAMVRDRVTAGQASIAEPYPGLYRMVRYARNGEVYGINMSRSIGDDGATWSTPEISMIKVSPHDVALVIASDGVFGSVHNDQVGPYVGQVMSQSHATPASLAQCAAEGLVHWCFDTETQREKSQANIDNLTALVLPLHGAP